MLDHALLAAARGHVRQTETLGDLEIGRFDAVTSVAVAFADCHLGLGVAEAADGEIIAVDGHVWRVPSDGVPVTAPPALGLPFAIGALGGRPVTVPLEPGMQFGDLTAAVDSMLSLANAEPTLVVALRIDGTFDDIVLRSEPRQDPPYRLLSDVLDHEVRFPFEHWEGTLVGFRFPDERDGIRIPGLHLHGIASDRRSGGHCHRATTRSVTMTAWIDDVQLTTP